MRTLMERTRPIENAQTRPIRNAKLGLLGTESILKVMKQNDDSGP